MGRPLKPIDADEVYRLASIGCTQDEIAGFFGCSQSVISDRFRSEYDLGRSASKITLRKRQWNASKRSVPMMIHLGKQMLGQSDKVEAEVRSESVIFERVDSPRDEAIPPPAETA